MAIMVEQACWGPTRVERAPLCRLKQGRHGLAVTASSTEPGARSLRSDGDLIRARDVRVTPYQ